MGALMIILAGLAVGVITSLIVRFVFLGISNLIERWRAHRGRTIAVNRAREALANAMQMAVKQEEINALNDLERIISQDSMIEAQVVENGKVDVDTVSILKGDTIDPHLTAYLDKHNGCLVTAV